MMVRGVATPPLVVALYGFTTVTGALTFLVRIMKSKEKPINSALTATNREGCDLTLFNWLVEKGNTTIVRSSLFGLSAIGRRVGLAGFVVARSIG